MSYHQAMLVAIRAPLFKSIAVAGAALLATAFVVPHHHRVVQTLELHAPKRPHAFYDTAWGAGDLHIVLPDGKPVPRTFQQRGMHWGCEWLATETITPDGPNRYFYTYDEEKLWCAEDAPPSFTTPRIGYAVVIAED